MVSPTEKYIQTMLLKETRERMFFGRFLRPPKAKWYKKLWHWRSLRKIESRTESRLQAWMGLPVDKSRIIRFRRVGL